MREPQLDTVLIYGFGYVGATLAAALVDAGLKVTVVENNPSKIARFQRTARLPFFEPNVDEILRSANGHGFSLVDRATGSEFDVAVICVGTPMHPESARPDLDQVYATMRDAVERIRFEGLLLMRSTVPVGTTRNAARNSEAAISEKRLQVAFCPERTIQGRALHEIKNLPQVVGGLTPEAGLAVRRFWERTGMKVTPVSSCDAAELVKLANNCHTDVIYGYGNQVALVAREHGLDPFEVIHAANRDYPRPDLHWPGYVGGSCLIKDPYLLLASVSERTQDELRIIRGARQANERYPFIVAETVRRELIELFGTSRRLRVLFCGIAYKGQPGTDDVRGGPIEAFLRVFGRDRYERFGHDFLVSADAICSFGIEPVDLEAASNYEFDALFFLNDHPRYKGFDLGRVCDVERPVYVLDSWRLFERERLTDWPSLVYRRLGDV